MGTARQRLLSECAARGLTPVFNRGVVGAPICVAGEAPGEDEARFHAPFVGASGAEQDRMLSEAGVSPSDVWFTNAYKVQPPTTVGKDGKPRKNDIGALPDLGVPLDVYQAEFIEELNQHRPSIIICTGASSLGVLCPSCRGRNGEVPSTKWAGSLLTSPHLQFPHYVLPVNHPAFVLRQWSERQTSVFVYGRAAQELAYLQTHGVLQALPQRELIDCPTLNDCFDFLWHLYHYPDPRMIVCDIEMNPSKDKQRRWKFVYLIGIATSAQRAISIPLWDFEPRHTAKLLHLLDNVFYFHSLCNQNWFNFDAPILEAQLGLNVNIAKSYDLMERHHVLWPELPHNLAFQTMMYTRQPFYKDEGKGIDTDSAADMVRYRRYNALDCAVTYEVFEAQEREFEERQ
jgi:uracil-DNA glycosylase